MAKLSVDEKIEIRKILDNIYAIEKDCDKHNYKQVDGTWETAVDDEEYESRSSESLYDIMTEIEKIVDIVK